MDIAPTKWDISPWDVSLFKCNVTLGYVTLEHTMKSVTMGHINEVYEQDLWFA